MENRDTKYSRNVWYVSSNYGLDNQLDKLLEEINELKEAIYLYKNNKKSLSGIKEPHYLLEHIIEEMADVSFLIDQVNCIFKSEDFFESMKLMKSNRTLWRLDMNMNTLQNILGLNINEDNEDEGTTDTKENN